jgi:hypothetical protein
LPRDVFFRQKCDGPAVQGHILTRAEENQREENDS